MRGKRTGEMEYDFTKNKKKITYKALVVALKKTSRLFTIFPDFSQVWKIAGQIFKPFSRIQDSVRTLSLGSTHVK